MSDPGAAGAQELLALAAEQLELVEHGRTDELAAVDARREAIMARLPQPLSPPARALLAEAVEAQRQVAAALTIGMARLGDELGRVSHGRTAMAGYAPAGMDARPMLDRTA
jgi:hypothetical protein